MSTASQADIAVTPTWTDLVAVNAALANVDLSIQAKCADVYIYAGGTTAPTSPMAGMTLDANDAVNLNAAHIWARSSSGGGPDDKLAVTLL